MSEQKYLRETPCGTIFGTGSAGGVAATVRNWSINSLREVSLSSTSASAP